MVPSAGMSTSTGRVTISETYCLYYTTLCWGRSWESNRQKTSVGMNYSYWIVFLDLEKLPLHGCQGDMPSSLCLCAGETACGWLPRDIRKLEGLLVVFFQFSPQILCLACLLEMARPSVTRRASTSFATLSHPVLSTYLTIVLAVGSSSGSVS